MAGSTLETERLRLRHIEAADAPFILALLNDPGWIRFIGDRGLRTEEQAREYIERVPRAAYAKVGFGLDLVERKEDGKPVGMCGLIRRDTLPDIDLGFALMPEYRGMGYAFEAGIACRDWGVQVLGLKRIVAITSPDNDDSGKLLLRLDFKYEATIPFGPEKQPVKYYGYAPQQPIINPPTSRKTPR